MSAIVEAEQALAACARAVEKATVQLEAARNAEAGALAELDQLRAAPAADGDGAALIAGAGDALAPAVLTRDNTGKRGKR